MKQWALLFCFYLLHTLLHAQTTLGITTDKTTSLVFPFSIRHVDRGTKDVLVQPVREADNILLVKAASANFPETNLSVVTEDGSLYSFIVHFDSNPTLWVHHLPVNRKATLATYANGILDNPRTIYGVRDRKYGMVAVIAGIYIQENTIFYQLRLENQSQVDYDIELLRFTIRNKQKGRRTASQENELKPLHVAGNTRQVKANNHTVIVVALEKFTIPDAKYLRVQVMEKNGGRHLSLRVNNNRIIWAIGLPDLR